MEIRYTKKNLLTEEDCYQLPNMVDLAGNNITHVPCKQNVVANALSRLPPLLLQLPSFSSHPAMSTPSLPTVGPSILVVDSSPSTTQHVASAPTSTPLPQAVLNMPTPCVSAADM